jgi:hypothetical protein
MRQVTDLFLVCPENSRYIVSVKLKKFNSFDADTLKQIVKSEEEIVGAVRTHLLN